jgi:hypothetical protein
MIDKQNKNISSLEAKLSNIQSKGLTLQKDEILYKYNDISDSIFLVLNGLIGLKNENEKNDFIKIKIKKDEFFGLEDVLQNIRRPHTAIALERSELLKIELMNISKQQINLLFNDLTKTRKTNNLLSSLTKTKDSNNLFGIQEVRGKKVVFFYGQHCNLTNAVLFKDYLFKYPCLQDDRFNLLRKFGRFFKKNNLLRRRYETCLQLRH